MDGLLSDRGESSRIARQVLSVWGVQVLQLCIQVGYTAVVSRHADAASFGQYATALAVAAAFSLFANAGLSNAAARRADRSVKADRMTLTVGLVTGLGTAALVLVTTPLWVRLWADPSATPAIAVVSLALAFGPAGSILSAVLRRQGRIGTYNLVQLVATGAALAVNVPIVLHYRSGWSLALLPGLTAAFLLLGAAWATGRRAVPTARLHGVRGDLTFGVKSMGLWGLAVIGNLMPLMALGRFCGTSVLGEWNRAQVVGRLPFETGVRGLLTVIFPRLAGGTRHDPGTRHNWSILTAGTAAFVLPAGCVLLPAAPAAVHVVLGSQWSMAAAMVPFVTVAGMGLVLTLVLSSALEASAFFHVAARADLVWLCATLAGVTVTAATGDWRGVAIGVAAAPMLSHAVQLLLCVRRGLLEAAIVTRWYAVVGLLSASLGGLSWVAVQIVSTPLGQVLVAAAILLIAVAVVVVAWRTNSTLRAAVLAVSAEPHSTGDAAT